MSTKTRKRRSVSSKQGMENGMSDNMRRDDVQPAGPAILRPLNWLIGMDIYVTSKLGFCATSGSSLGFLRPFMKFLEYSCHGIPWLICTVSAILMFHEAHLLEILVNLLSALILDLIIVGFTKLVIARKRPSHNEMDMFATISVDKHSFPSGHTTRAAMVTLFFIDKFVLTGSTRLLAYIWMLTVIFSRIFLGRHHVLDVVAGLVFGFLQYVAIVNYLWIPQETCMHFLVKIHEDLHL